MTIKIKVREDLRRIKIPDVILDTTYAPATVEKMKYISTNDAGIVKAKLNGRLVTLYAIDLEFEEV